ncbi:MAG: hypothetical protein IPN42_08050 [Methylococcaceae bacterium]|nr:hypothetical protein [Methylococcaceae bacterium]
MQDMRISQYENALVIPWKGSVGDAGGVLDSSGKPIDDAFLVRSYGQIVTAVSSNPSPLHVISGKAFFWWLSF